MSHGLKGLVLAAGLGTRLRPLTELYPKPLVPFAGTTPLALAQARLLACGIDQQAVNAHYKAEMVAAYVGSRPLKAAVVVSHEPEILGTGGCYNPLRAWLDGADLVVLNGDVVADFNLAELIKRHRELDAVASMMLLPSVLPGEAAVFYRDARVVAIGRSPPPGPVTAGNFACAQILSRRFLELLPKAGVFDIISKGYQVALAAGSTVGVVQHDGIWHDLRTPDYYWAALHEVLLRPQACADLGVAALRQAQGLAPLPDHRGVLTAQDVRTFGKVHLGPCVVVEAGVQIGDGARISHSVLLPGAVVPPGAVLDRCLVGPALHTTFLPIPPLKGAYSPPD